MNKKFGSDQGGLIKVLLAGAVMAGAAAPALCDPARSVPAQDSTREATRSEAALVTSQAGPVASSRIEENNTVIQQHRNGPIEMRRATPPGAAGGTAPLSSAGAERNSNNDKIICKLAPAFPQPSTGGPAAGAQSSAPQRLNVKPMHPQTPLRGGMSLPNDGITQALPVNPELPDGSKADLTWKGERTLPSDPSQSAEDEIKDAEITVTVPRNGAQPSGDDDFCKKFAVKVEDAKMQAFLREKKKRAHLKLSLMRNGQRLRSYNLYSETPGRNTAPGQPGK